MRLAGGLTFSLGLILVVVGGAELFTGNNLIAMAWASGRVTTQQVMRDWGWLWEARHPLLKKAGVEVKGTGYWRFEAQASNLTPLQF
jgi:hypothetical protein